LEEGGRRKEAEAYGCHFRIPGATCSLVMLESQSDYDRFRLNRKEDRVVLEKVLVAGGPVAGKRRRRETEWLRTMLSAPGLSIERGEELVALASRLSGDSLRLPQTELVTTSDPCERYVKALAQGRLEAAVVRREAERRAGAEAAGALLALSSLVEQEPGTQETLREAGLACMGWGFYGHGYYLLRRAQRLRPFEPNALRAMGLCSMMAGRADLAILTFETLLRTTWDRRYAGIRRVVRYDLLGLLRRIERGKVGIRLNDFARRRQRELALELEPRASDLLVSLLWSTDRSNVDLCVDEPGLGYTQSNRAGAGQMLATASAGYGPELYRLEQGAPGRYHVLARYHEKDWSRVSSSARVLTVIYQRWGRPGEAVSLRSGVLTRGRERALLGGVATIRTGVTRLQLATVELPVHPE
jgi:hypothetical protein